ncbi:MAG: FAD-binding protein [Thermoplasmata archaeon]|nr:MAG: FAD-binding protein [Thermoplasmata archaeon]
MLDKGFLDKLKGIVGDENCRTDTAERYCYAFDGGIHRAMPDAVVRPQTTQQISDMVKLANEYKVPIIPRGAGTALCGHSVAISGGVSVDLQGMNKIKEIHVEDLYVVVEPGVIYDQLNAALAEKKFFFPPDPGSAEACTIGGMAACNASGMRAIKYGATREYVLGLEVVMPTGEIVEMGSRTIKDSSGYQFAKFMLGSEGTLGIITEITLRVIPKPKKNAVAVAAFNKLEEAGQGVSNIIGYPVLPSGIELMDDVCIKAVNQATNLGLPEVEALLLIEVDGHPEAVKEDIEKVAEICKSSGATSVEYTDDEKRKVELRKGRKSMIPALSRYKPEWAAVILADDMAVPISKIPQTVKAFHEIADKHGIIVATYGHAADGNLHTKVLMDPLDPEHWKHGEQATAEIFEAVHNVGGTTTGEHGTGITKAPYMRAERKSLIEFMKKIKRTLDPNNIMNPNKMMDWEEGIITHLRYPVNIGGGTDPKNPEGKKSGGSD